VASRRPRIENFDEAARRVAADSKSKPDANPDAWTLEILRKRLAAFVAHRFGSGLDDADRHDAVEEALLSFAAAAARGAVRVDTAPAYLLTTTRHKAVDALRRRRRWNAELTPDMPELRASDETERLFDREGAREAVREALGEFISASALEDVRILMTWLDLSEGSDDGPSARLVAREAGVSHTSVNRTLARLRERLAPRLGDD